MKIITINATILDISIRSRYVILFFNEIINETLISQYSDITRQLFIYLNSFCSNSSTNEINL